MRYAVPRESTLSVTDSGVTYTKRCYTIPKSLSGVVDESYPAYDPGATYNTGDQVIVPELKTIYKCAADGVSGVFPPSDKMKWVDFGFVNSYRMLAVDEQINEKTVGTDIVMEFDFARATTIAFVNTRFDSVQVEQIDDTTGDIVNSVQIDGRTIGCKSFSEYFFADAKYKTRIILDSLTWLKSSTLRISFTGDVAIGTVVIGRAQDMGVTLYGTSLEFQDKSVVKTDPITGFRNVVRYGNVRVLDAKILIDTGDFNQIAQRISEIIGKNVLWIPTKLDKFSEMSNIAYIESAPLPIDNPAKNESQITMIGVI